MGRGRGGEDKESGLCVQLRGQWIVTEHAARRGEDKTDQLKMQTDPEALPRSPASSGTIPGTSGAMSEGDEGEVGSRTIPDQDRAEEEGAGDGSNSQTLESEGKLANALRDLFNEMVAEGSWDELEVKVDLDRAVDRVGGLTGDGTASASDWGLVLGEMGGKMSLELRRQGLAKLEACWEDRKGDEVGGKEGEFPATVETDEALTETRTEPMRRSKRGRPEGSPGKKGKAGSDLGRGKKKRRGRKVEEQDNKSDNDEDGDGEGKARNVDTWRASVINLARARVHLVGKNGKEEAVTRCSPRQQATWEGKGACVPAKCYRALSMALIKCLDLSRLGELQGNRVERSELGAAGRDVGWVCGSTPVVREVGKLRKGEDRRGLGVGNGGRGNGREDGEVGQGGG